MVYLYVYKLKTNSEIRAALPVVASPRGHARRQLPPFVSRARRVAAPSAIHYNGIAERVPSRRRASQPACQPARQAPRHPFKGADDLGALKAAHFQSRRRARSRKTMYGRKRNAPAPFRFHSQHLPLPKPQMASSLKPTRVQLIFLFPANRQRPSVTSSHSAGMPDCCCLARTKGTPAFRYKSSGTAAKRDSRDFRVRPNERLLHRVSTV